MNINDLRVTAHKVSFAEKSDLVYADTLISWAGDKNFYYLVTKHSIGFIL